MSAGEGPALGLCPWLEDGQLLVVSLHTIFLLGTGDPREKPGAKDCFFGVLLLSDASLTPGSLLVWEELKVTVLLLF